MYDDYGMDTITTNGVSSQPMCVFVKPESPNPEDPIDVGWENKVREILVAQRESGVKALTDDCIASIVAAM